jgi:hypothetical protein
MVFSLVEVSVDGACYTGRARSALPPEAVLANGRLAVPRGCLFGTLTVAGGDNLPLARTPWGAGLGPRSGSHLPISAYR